jgi:hypothetical protein
MNEERFPMDSEMEEKLNLFFTGLEAGLKSLREVRSAFDEEVAFDFNPLEELFSINENKVTDILAYFLDPEGKHGQKDRLLKVFLKKVRAAGAIKVLRDPTKKVTVKPQSFTENGRPIDAVLIFGDYEYIIGIENKVFGAVDQEGQVRDYCKDLGTRAEKANAAGKFLMLYLSPRGEAPSANSIHPDVLEEYKDKLKFKIIPFCSAENKVSVLSILKAMADEARADSVRSFLKLFIKYLETYFKGGTTVAEQTFVIDYLKKHPDFILEIRSINEGYDSIKRELASNYYSAIQQLLKQVGVELPGWPYQNDDQDVICAGLLQLPDDRLYISITEGGIGLYCKIPEGAKVDETKECWLEAVNKIPDTKLKNFIIALANKKDITRPANWNWRWLIVKELKFHDFGNPYTLKCILDKSSGVSVDFNALQCEPPQVVNNVLSFIKDINDELKNAGLPYKEMATEIGVSCMPPIVVK